jgi:hypothetical protein
MLWKAQQSTKLYQVLSTRKAGTTLLLRQNSKAPNISPSRSNLVQGCQHFSSSTPRTFDSSPPLQQASIIDMVKSSIDSLPPFPDNVHIAPIARISSRKLLEGNSEESKNVLEACQTYGFFYLDLTDSPSGETLLEHSEKLLELSKIAFQPPKEEKMKYELQKGVNLFGYKAAGTVKKTDKDLRPDTTEFFNVAKVSSMHRKKIHLKKLSC